MGAARRACTPHAFLAWQPPPSRQQPLTPGSLFQGVGAWPRPRPLLAPPTSTPPPGAGTALSVHMSFLLSLSGAADWPQGQFSARRSTPPRHARVGAAQCRRLGGGWRQGPSAQLKEPKQHDDHAATGTRARARARLPPPGVIVDGRSWKNFVEKSKRRRAGARLRRGTHPPRGAARKDHVCARDHQQTRADPAAVMTRLCGARSEKKRPHVSNGTLGRAL